MMRGGWPLPAAVSLLLWATTSPGVGATDLRDSDPTFVCRLRCAADAVGAGANVSDALDDCGQRRWACDSDECWRSCGGALPSSGGSPPTTPTDLRLEYGNGSRNPYLVNINFRAGVSAVQQLFVIFERSADSTVFEYHTDPTTINRTVIGEGAIFAFEDSEGIPCVGKEVRVYAVNAYGLSPDFVNATLDDPIDVYNDMKLLTEADLNLRLENVTYRPGQPFKDTFGKLLSNGTVEMNFLLDPPKFILRRDLVFNHNYNLITPWMDIGLSRCTLSPEHRTLSYDQKIITSDFDSGRITVKEPGILIGCPSVVVKISKLFTKCRYGGQGGSRSLQMVNGPPVIFSLHCNHVHDVPKHLCKQQYPPTSYHVFDLESWTDGAAGRLELSASKDYYFGDLLEEDAETVPVRLRFRAPGEKYQADLERNVPPVAVFLAFARAKPSHDLADVIAQSRPEAEDGISHVLFELESEEDLLTWRLCPPVSYLNASNNWGRLPLDCAASQANLSVSIEKDVNGTDYYNLNLPDIRLNTLYGVAFASAYKPDYTMADFRTSMLESVSQPSQARAVGIELSVSKRPMSHLEYAGVIGGPLLAVTLLLGALSALLYRRHRRNRAEMRKLREEAAEASGIRYTEMPKKEDFYEISRRHVQIFEEEKLGSGAFGAVFKGKVLGKIRTHQDSNSHLATHIMRTENAEVAIKMLPEYADDLSKADFLKEINLMKQLGFHERLVNMLACVTESEPYLLIVEFCSDGDLLHFLRQRRKYMMKLDDLGINYASAESADDFDPEMVLSLKELLGYALQISYGLEYLSQKGFIHRDVAARNVLIHDRLYAKIGDFGLCRYVLGNDAAYWGKGGRLPIKWMAPEAIRNYEFSTASDVWSFGVLLFEIVTMGGSPYPGIQPADMEAHLDAGHRMAQPDNCPDPFYEVMRDCWEAEAEKRLSFSESRQRLAALLEETTADYSYLALDAARDYYNVQYSESGDTVQTDNALNEARLRSSIASAEAASPPPPATRDKLSESIDSGFPNPTPTPFSDAGRHFSFGLSEAKAKVARIPLETIHSDSTSSELSPAAKPVFDLRGNEEEVSI